MIYSMSDPNLLDAMDRYKTGNYGEDDYADQITSICPICGRDAESVYLNEYTAEIVGCEECVKVQDFTE